MIDSESKSAASPNFKANEKFIKSQLLFPKLDMFEKYLKDNKTDNSLKILKELVEEWVH